MKHDNMPLTLISRRADHINGLAQVVTLGEAMEYARRYAEQCCRPLAKALDDLYFDRNADTEQAAKNAIKDYMKESS